MKLSAPCKINLGLDILRRRADGYHDIETVMCAVAGLADEISVEPSDVTQFRGEGLVVDCPDDKNLCVRAARLMQERYGAGNVAITLNKCVPFGVGLGGGSSDAAAVIVAINTIFGLGLSTREMCDVAAELGSDTSFFVLGTPQLCTSRGEVMTPFDLSRLSGRWIVIVKPPFGVSTPQAYAGVQPQVPATPLVERLSGDLSTWRESLTNDFERTVFALHPSLADIKAQLYNAGAFYASMSGSGSAMFGLFEHQPEIQFNDSLFIFEGRL
ncbi:MAG: 4-(cytidine 5'-diphospho)-2-C-methyl-D-erythritol kinase [Rikenellaceae bacterium]|nr:4-(cytidine 5'-diphospho)-2-C-methyl-D-erythritol kinase [Rikenellaceae bacterium]